MTLDWNVAALLRLGSRCRVWHATVHTCSSHICLSYHSAQEPQPQAPVQKDGVPRQAIRLAAKIGIARRTQSAATRHRAGRFAPPAELFAALAQWTHRFCPLPGHGPTHHSRSACSSADRWEDTPSYLHCVCFFKKNWFMVSLFDVYEVKEPMRPRWCLPRVSLGLTMCAGASFLKLCAAVRVGSHLLVPPQRRTAVALRQRPAPLAVLGRSWAVAF